MQNRKDGSSVRLGEKHTWVIPSIRGPVDTVASRYQAHRRSSSKGLLFSVAGNATSGNRPIVVGQNYYGVKFYVPLLSQRLPIIGSPFVCLASFLVQLLLFGGTVSDRLVF